MGDDVEGRSAEPKRFEEVSSTLGAPGFEAIRDLSDIRDEVGEIVGVEISFDD